MSAASFIDIQRGPCRVYVMGMLQKDIPRRGADHEKRKLQIPGYCVDLR
jgi:hypothetical protein